MFIPRETRLGERIVASFFAFFFVVGLALVYDLYVDIQAESAHQQDLYEKCKSICYPHPAYPYQEGPNHECVCDVGTEYRK